MKTLDQAVKYVLDTHSPELIHKGGNYATFDCKVWGMFDIMPDHKLNKWWAFVTHGSDNKGFTYQTLFYIA